MEHHEASNGCDSSRRQDDEGAYYGSSGQPALIRPCSPPMETANFRSQRISSSPTNNRANLCNTMGIPLVQPPSALGQHNVHVNDTKASRNHSAQDDSLSNTSVGTIPVFPSFHILERTAIQISEDTVTLGDLLDRIFHYLKSHSIRYECEPDTGCFDCTSPNCIEFAVQLWRARQQADSIWVEVSRRRGCSLAMNSIRRSLLRHLKGEPAPAAAAPSSAAGTRRPCPDSTLGSNKRQRSMTPQEARLSCQDALVVTVRLLESDRKDQQQYGVESLAVLTNPKVVGSIDATTVSRAIILGEGPAGPRLQQRLVSLLQEIQPTLMTAGMGQFSQYQTQGVFYHFILYSLANGLSQVSCGGMTPRMDLKSPFWHTVTSCLRASLEDALRKPHEATMAAKCLRFLLPSKTEDTLHPPTLRGILARTHEAGRAINLGLEEESRKTLAFLG